MSEPLTPITLIPHWQHANLQIDRRIMERRRIAWRYPKPISVGFGSEHQIDLRHGNSVRAELRRKLRRRGVVVSRFSSLAELRRIASAHSGI